MMITIKETNLMMNMTLAEAKQLHEEIGAIKSVDYQQKPKLKELYELLAEATDSE